MADVLGWLAISVAGLVTLVLSVRYRQIGLALMTAFAVRAAAALFHFYIAPLPDGTTDAVTFERYAWEWGQGGISSLAANFPGMDAYFYSWLMAVLYTLTDRSLLMLQGVSVCVGVIVVYHTWRLAEEVWNEAVAHKAAWLMALFPMVVQYSALPMREVWVTLFFVLGLRYVVRWERHGGSGPVVAGIAAFVSAAFFHGGMFVAALAFLGLVMARSGLQLLSGILRNRISLAATAGVVLSIVVVGYYVASGVSVHKLGTFQDLLSAEQWFYYFESRVDGGAPYPEWTQPQSLIDFVWAIPLRAVYLLFSPFPWDIHKPSHLVGLIDALFYLYLAFVGWRYSRAILTNPAAKSILLILVPLVLAFGVGTGNFGTSLRHRAKLVVALIVLASPGLPRLVLNGTRHGTPGVHDMNTTKLNGQTVRKKING